MDLVVDINKPEQGRLFFYLVDSTDKSTAKTGLTPALSFVDVGTVAFAASGVTVVEVGNGIYTHSGSLPTTHCDAQGTLLYKLTGTAALDAFGTVTVKDPANAAIYPANMKQISDDTTAADNAESFFDGTGYAGTNNVIPTVTTLTNLPSIPNNWLTAAGINAGAFTSSKFATDAIDANAIKADAVTEIQNGLATASALSTVGTAVIAIQTKTDQLTFDANGVNANMEAANGVAFIGDGSAGNKFRV